MFVIYNSLTLLPPNVGHRSDRIFVLAILGFIKHESPPKKHYMLLSPGFVLAGLSVGASGLNIIL